MIEIRKTGGRILGKTSTGRAAKTFLGLKVRCRIFACNLDHFRPIRKMYLRPLLCSSGVPSLRGGCSASCSNFGLGVGQNACNIKGLIAGQYSWTDTALLPRISVLDGLVHLLCFELSWNSSTTVCVSYRSNSYLCILHVPFFIYLFQRRAL